MWHFGIMYDAFLQSDFFFSKEKDTNGDVLWAWSYPSITSEQRQFLQLKSGLSTEQQASPVNFVYCQWRQTWYYILRADITSGSEGSPLSKVGQILLMTMNGVL